MSVPGDGKNALFFFSFFPSVALQEWLGGTSFSEYVIQRLFLSNSLCVPSCISWFGHVPGCSCRVLESYMLYDCLLSGMF